jgi:hypothetical protein
MRKILIICAVLVLISSSLLANKNHIYNRYLGHVLKSVSLFDGDKYGDFEDNLVAILSDGSSWKIHPHDQNTFSNWQVDDPIRMRVRNSFYWFKREHKFELVNEARQEEVRAMIVHYGDFPHKIVGCQRKVIGYRMGVCQNIDAVRGQLKSHYYPTLIYKTVLRLEDGSHWITEGGCYFKNEEKAYIFIDQETGFFILVTGHEREAMWQQIVLESLNPK